jgi:hypothetical protein
MKLTVWATTYKAESLGFGVQQVTVYDWSEAEPGDVTTIELTNAEFDDLKVSELWYQEWQQRLEQVYEEG